jgi:outer membrane protein OmpA-like peptidoglycan-associated protein
MRLLFVVLLSLVACTPPRERVVLLEVTETEGQLTVQTTRRTLTLDTAYQTATARPSGRLDAGITTADIVEARYGGVLRTTPEAGRLYRLSFAPGATTLTPESQPVVRDILTDTVSHAAFEVVIEGHTDTTGDMETNDRLSLERAHAVRTLLVGQGMTAPFLRVIGRGERQLLVPTPDEVDEPRNRRVEVIIR